MCAPVDESHYFLFFARSLKFPPRARAQFEELSNRFFMVNAFAFAETRSLRNSVENAGPRGRGV